MNRLIDWLMIALVLSFIACMLLAFGALLRHDAMRGECAMRAKWEFVGFEGTYCAKWSGVES